MWHTHDTLRCVIRSTHHHEQCHEEGCNKAPSLQKHSNANLQALRGGSDARLTKNLTRRRGGGGGGGGGVYSEFCTRSCVDRATELSCEGQKKQPWSCRIRNGLLAVSFPPTAALVVAELMMMITREAKSRICSPLTLLWASSLSPPIGVK